MRTAFVLLILVSLFTFGCIGGEEEFVEEGETTLEEEENETVENETVEEEETEEEEELEECETSYSFSTLEDGVFSKETVFAVSGECAGGETVALYVDDEKVAEQQISTNNPVVINFQIVPKKEGTRSVEVKAAGETVYSGSWEVTPLGSQDTSGNKNEDVSSKKWLAIAFDIENEVTVKSAGTYMRRLHSGTLEDSYVIAEIRPDNNGEPAESYRGQASVPITEPTMTTNWIWFNFEQEVSLDEGRYWLVFRVDYPELVSDVVNIHYVGEDTTAPPNDYTKKMTLVWDDDERAYLETEWESLAYDKEYAVVLSGLEH